MFVIRSANKVNSPKHPQKRFFSSNNHNHILINAIRNNETQTITAFINDKKFVPDEDVLSAMHLSGNKQLLNSLLQDYRINSDIFRQFASFNHPITNQYQCSTDERMVID